MSPDMIINIAVLIPISLLIGWVSALSAKVSKMQRDYYDKAETDMMINLRMEPIRVELSNITRTTQETKVMLEKLLDGKYTIDKRD